jgi:predicted flap endonuclease-1-like 5' DNA nuclease
MSPWLWLAGAGGMAALALVNRRRTAAPAGVGGREDDLTQISGIGPVISRKLHQIGIRSFSQLARANPEVIRNALREEGLEGTTLVNPDSWQDQAREAIRSA